MKTTAFLIGMLLLVSLVSRVDAQVNEIRSFTNLNITIPDGNASGLSDVRTVTSAIANLSSVRLKLRIAGEFNGDLYGYVRHIQGGTTNLCVLLNRVGRTAANAEGYADAGFEVVFDDTAPNDIHAYRGVTNPPAGSPLIGTWQPDGRRVDPAVVIDTTDRTATLGLFTNAVAGGEWTLFLADVASGGTNMLAGWELEFTGIATPVVTWPTPADITYGTALGATQLNASSPVDGTYVYSPPAGTFLNAGNNQVLSVTFNPTDTDSYVSVTTHVSINVLKAPLSITASGRSKTYGDVVTFAGTEFTTVGLTNSDAVASVTLASDGAAGTATVAGSPYAIVSSAAVGTGLGNYAISYANGTLIVGAKTLSITANGRSKSYGDVVTFAGTEFTTVGLTNSDAVASVTLASTGAAGTAAVAGSPYAIVSSAAVGTGLGNYAISYVNGTLTVGAKGLTIMANDRGKVYGQTVTFAGTEFTTVGLTNSDSVNSATLTSSGTPATAAVGSYAIAPTDANGMGLANYTISYGNGTLTVIPVATTGTLVSSANPASPGTLVSFTYSLSAAIPGAGAPTGSVQFKVDGANAGSPVTLNAGVAAYADSTLAVGLHTVQAEYAGSLNFLGTANSLVPNQLINTPPVAGTDTIERWATNGTKVSITALLANDSDADAGDTITFTSVSTTSANLMPVVLTNGWIFYNPSPGFTNPDSFTYTITDSHGGTATGTVQVTIKVDDAQSQNILAISDMGDDGFRITFNGIPYRIYTIQYTTDLDNPSWQFLGTAQADSFGVATYDDLEGSPQRFYRSVYP